MEHGVTDGIGVAGALALSWHLILAGGVIVSLAVFFFMLATGRISLSKMKESWWWWWWIP